MLEHLTATQLAEWEEYNKLDPIGEQRDDFRNAYLLMTMTNLAIGIHGKKGSKLTKIEDYIVDWDAGGKEEVQQSAEDMKNFLMSFASSHNKKVQKDNKQTPTK